MREVCCAFSLRYRIKTRGNCLAKGLHGICCALESVGGNLAEDRFEFGKQLFDGVEIGTVGGKIDENGAACLDGFSHADNLVDADVIHEHDIATLEGWCQNLFDIGPKRVAIHCSFKHEGCGHTVEAQRRNECGGFPVTVQHLLDQTVTLWCA